MRRPARRAHGQQRDPRAGAREPPADPDQRRPGASCARRPGVPPRRAPRRGRARGGGAVPPAPASGAAGRRPATASATARATASAPRRPSRSSAEESPTRAVAVAHHQQHAQPLAEVRRGHACRPSRSRRAIAAAGVAVDRRAVQRIHCHVAVGGGEPSHVAPRGLHGRRPRLGRARHDGRSRDPRRRGFGQRPAPAPPSATASSALSARPRPRRAGFKCRDSSRSSSRRRIMELPGRARQSVQSSSLQCTTRVRPVAAPPRDPRLRVRVRHRGHEVRRHLRRRRRAHQARRAPHRRRARAGPPRRRRAVRARQDDRRADLDGRGGLARPRTRARWTCCSRPASASPARCARWRSTTSATGRSR